MTRYLRLAVGCEGAEVIKSQMSCAQFFRKFSASASLWPEACARAAAAAAHGCMLSVAPRTPVAVLRPRGVRGGLGAMPRPPSVGWIAKNSTPSFFLIKDQYSRTSRTVVRVVQYEAG